MNVYESISNLGLAHESQNYTGIIEVMLRAYEKVWHRS